MSRMERAFICTGTWKRRMWSWASRSETTIQCTESKVGFGVIEVRAGWLRRSWERRVVGRADSVDI